MKYPDRDQDVSANAPLAMACTVAEAESLSVAVEASGVAIGDEVFDSTTTSRTEIVVSACTHRVLPSACPDP